MPKNLNPDEVRNILESGNFDEFIGVVEDNQLECKAAPYQVQNDHEKQELAKDVSGLANADGGVILISVRTERDPTHFGDGIKEIRPFAQALVNPEQYQDILRSWIYPPLQQVDIRWFPSAANPGKGIVAIFIPRQPLTRQPFLATKIIDDNDKLSTVVFGYFERRRANVNHRSVQELHTLLRDGLQYDSLNQRLESIEEMLQSFRAEQARQTQLAPRPNILGFLNERIEQALIAATLQSKPAFILTAVPTQPVEMPTLFERRDADIVRLLEHPPRLREAGFGFGLDTGASARIVQGQLRRAVDSGYKILELWRDGTLIFGVTGGGDFLCWGSHTIRGGPLRINQLALIESTYLFAELSRQVFEQAQPRPTAIEYRLELRNMTVDGTPCGLIPGPLGTFAWRFETNIHRAPDSNGTLIARWEEAEINSGAVTFHLVSRVYEWFSIDHDQIPYTERIDGRSVISPEQIRSAGK